jgi:hypothetical protein
LQEHTRSYSLILFMYYYITCMHVTHVNIILSEQYYYTRIIRRKKKLL